MIRTALYAILGCSWAAALGADVNVTYIERTPRYDYNAAKNNPAVGDVVTFTGHIKNWGPGALAAIEYQWLIDGAEVASGTLTNVAENEERTVTRQWTWAAGNHRVKLVADPNHLIAESSESNNTIDDRINSIIAGFWVEQSVYNYFHQYQKDLGIGANSWEDWIQRQMAKQNQLYEQAIWPNSPQGVLDRVRIDKIVLVADGALPLHGGLATNNPDLWDRTIDLMWGFPSANALPPASTFYANHTSTSETNPFYIEQSLLHELGHARYLIDSYGFDVHNTSSHHSVQIYEGATYVAGSAYMPFLAWGEVLHYNVNGGVMSGPYGFMWSPYEAGALNLIAGRRAGGGNYNAPSNIGIYLQDLPQRNHLKLTGAGGVPRVNANVRVYNCTSGPGWYGKTFDNTYDQEYTTDSDGDIHLPRNPFSTGNIQHTYGIANSVMILRIQQGPTIWYRFVEAAEFNMQYWAGNTQDAYYTLELPGTVGDGDADGLPDDWEYLYFGNTSHTWDVDEEPDGLNNLQEYEHSTVPNDADTDNDGLNDGVEVNTTGTNPTKPDTDGDGDPDGADNCPLRANADQQDTDSDTIGDACDACPISPGSDPNDADGDGIGDSCDACPGTPAGVQVTPLGCPAAKPDFDKDTDVDQEDFARLQACFTEAGQMPVFVCAAMDLNGDDRVNALDTEIFIGCVSGPNQQADYTCAP